MAVKKEKRISHVLLDLQIKRSTYTGFTVVIIIQHVVL